MNSMWFCGVWQNAGETYKLQAAGEHLQEIVEPEQDDPQTLHCGGTCAAGADTAQGNC